LRSIRTAADLSAVFESLGSLLSSHRAVTRVSVAALSFTLIATMTQQSASVITAGPEPAPLVPESLLPQSVGVAIPSDESVTIAFESAVDPAAVEAAIQVLPAQKFRVAWNEDATELSLSPERRWRTDEQYLVVVPAEAVDSDGTLATPRRYSFTTQAAPVVADFQVRLADAGTDAGAAAPARALAVEPDAASAPEPEPGTLSPEQIAEHVSATSEITISFSAPMDASDVEDHFVVSPAIEGELSWRDGSLVFAPAERLEPGARYTISVIGSHDAMGNLIGGEANFSFVVQPGAQVTKTQPEGDATDVEPATVEIWFSQPMDVDATNAAFALTDASNGGLVGGLLNWNDAGTQLIYTPDGPFIGGRTFEVSLGEGARDADGNPVTATWSFSTKAAAVATAPSRSTTSTRTAPAPLPLPPAPATSLAGHALNQVNAARAAYGFGPVVLDASISAVAAAHAWDQANQGYFSHYSLDGRSREDRLRAGGVGFSWSGENQCYRIGMSEQATLDWCHAQFMAEPYPGQWNHIANILNPNARRMGVGIATVGSTTVITWNFTD